MVNPTFMIGPYDSKPGFGAIIIAICKERMPGCAVGGRNYIYVNDVAFGIANALEKSRIGETYIMGNQNLSYREIFDKIAHVVGVTSPKYKFPPFLIKALGLVSSIFSKITGKPPLFTPAVARIACDEHYYTAEKAIDELNLPQTSIEEAIREAYIWFKDNGYL